jgi:uncharacterized membrane protein YfcA
MDQVLIVLIVFLAVFTQSLSGFGSALVAMALLPELVGMGVATPLVAVMAMTVEGCLLLRYHASLNLSAVWRLVLASLVGIPLGMLALKRFDENAAMSILGIVIVAYAVYALLELKPPELSHPAWGFAFGLLAGMLGGAYNTSGPPVVVYGNSRRWIPAEFKSNLQGFFLLNSVLVVSGHALSHNITQAVIQNYLIALPALALGILAGISLDRLVNPDLFRKLVLVLLLAMGVRMMLV